MSSSNFVVRHRLPLLLATAAVLVVLNLTATNTPETVAAVSRPDIPDSLPQSSVRTFPKLSERQMLEPATSDPFFGKAPVVAVATQPSKSVPIAPPAETPAPSIPAAPALGATFAGRVQLPNGKTVVYLAFNESSLVAAPGLVLPNGYRLDTLGEDRIEFTYPLTNTSARIDIPAPPSFEIR